MSKKVAVGDALDALKDKFNRAFERINRLRAEEAPGRASRAELIDWIEREINDLTEICDLQCGYTDPDDPFAFDALGVLRWEFAELTWPVDRYPNTDGPRYFSGKRMNLPTCPDFPQCESNLPVESRSETDEQMTARFLRALYAPYEKGWIEIRAIPQQRFRPRLGTKQHWFALEEVRAEPWPLINMAAVWASEGLDVYVGVLPRGVHGKSRKNTIYEAGAVWIELDFDKQDGGEAATIQKAEALDPEIIVRSGGGLHLYWTMAKTVALDTVKMKQFEMSLKSRQASAGGDIVADCTRILRLPQTLNWKLDEPRKVELLKCP